MMKRVFADANIFFAATASRKGASHATLLLAEIGLIKLLASRQVIDEVERNLRRKFPPGLPFLLEWLTRIELEILPDPEPEEYIRWLSIIEKTDAPILEAALQGSPDYFLTLNTKDFTAGVAAVTGLNIMTPGEFIQGMRQVINRIL
jgi:predicted nucleic acid-binding protein